MTEFVPQWVADLGDERIDRLIDEGKLRVYPAHEPPDILVNRDPGDETDAE